MKRLIILGLLFLNCTIQTTDTARLNKMELEFSYIRAVLDDMGMQGIFIPEKPDTSYCGASDKYIYISNRDPKVWEYRVYPRQDSVGFRSYNKDLTPSVIKWELGN